MSSLILCLLALAVLSWTPGVYMVRTGVLSGHTEHFLAYFLSATIISAAQRRATASVWIGLMLYAVALELGQLYVPGRHAAAADFYASAFGAVAGAAIAFAFFRTIERAILNEFGFAPASVKVRDVSLLSVQCEAVGIEASS
jgi:VanZ family protein